MGGSPKVLATFAMARTLIPSCYQALAVAAKIAVAITETPNQVVPPMPEDELTASSSGDAESSQTQAGLFDSELQPGTVIGEFEIVRKLGSGGASQVYLARQQPLDRLIALKISAGSTSEGATLAALEHDHIVPVFTERIVGQHRLLAMRYIPGITLSLMLIALNDRDRQTLRQVDLIQLIEEFTANDSTNIPEPHATQTTLNAPFERAVCGLILELAQALAYAHNQGVLHRDLKPDNVLLTQDGRAMLFDFNVAVKIGHLNNSGATTLGGTLAYMSPEHLAAFVGTSFDSDVSDPVDASSDVFSLGIVFFELLTGRRPFHIVDAADSSVAAAREILAARISGRPVFANDQPRISPAVQSIVKKCLAIQRTNGAEPVSPSDSTRRYQSADQLVEDLQRFLKRQRLQYATDPGSIARASRWTRTHPIQAALIVVVSVASLLAADAWYVFRCLRLAEQQVAVTLSKSNSSPTDAVVEIAAAESTVLHQESLIDFPGLKHRRGRLYHDLGLIHFRAGHYEQGISYFRKSIDCNPDLAESHNNLGVGLFRLRQFPEALAAFDRAIELGYDGADVLANRGATRVATGDLDGARRDFNRALQIDPQSKPARQNLELLDKLHRPTAQPSR